MAISLRIAGCILQTDAYIGLFLRGGLAGLPHGTLPGTVEISIGAKEAKGLARMVDKLLLLMPNMQALEIEKNVCVVNWAE